MMKLGSEVVPYVPIASRTRNQIRKKRIITDTHITFLLTNTLTSQEDQTFLDFLTSAVLKDVPLPGSAEMPIKINESPELKDHMQQRIAVSIDYPND